MNDPGELYTYASTSTLPDVSRWIFFKRLIGPDSPIYDGEYVGKYTGWGNLTAADFQRYMMDPNPDRQTMHMISIQGIIRDGWDYTGKNAPAWPPLVTTHV